VLCELNDYLARLAGTASLIGSGIAARGYQLVMLAARRVSAITIFSVAIDNSSAAATAAGTADW
jgi:ornithine cyclodeaminase/alanine dehydrogenase-like protein (mu-crystallin family)